MGGIKCNRCCFFWVSGPGPILMCYFSDRQENLKYQLAGEKSGRGQERKEWSVRGEEGETGPW